MDDEARGLWLWSASVEKLVISLFKRTRGDSMEAVQDGSSESRECRAVAGVEANAAWLGKNELSLLRTLVS